MSPKILSPTQHVYVGGSLAAATVALVLLATRSSYECAIGVTRAKVIVSGITSRAARFARLTLTLAQFMLRDMQMNFTPEVEAQLNQLVSATGRSHEVIANELLAEQLSEMIGTRAALNSRYDDLVSGRVQGIDGETARRQVLAGIEARRIAAQSK